MTNVALSVGRLVVVQPEPPEGLESSRLEIGVIAWNNPTHALTVIAKTTLDYRPPEGAVGAAVRDGGSSGGGEPRAFFGPAELVGGGRT